MTVTHNALRYVAQRQATGHLNTRSAAQLRYRLLDFANHAPDKLRSVRRHHVERWMERPDLSPQYRRTRLSAVRGFFRWAVAHRLIPHDPTLAIEAPRIPDAVPKRLRPDEARALVAHAASDTRTLLIVLLMLQEGLRRIEISRLDVADIDPAERTILVRGKGGGGHHTAVLPISDETWAAIRAHLAEEGHTHGPLVRNRVRRHGRLSPSTISEIVRQAMIDAGIKVPGDASRTPHSCRHTAAHDILAATHDVRAVQQALRHASVRSTEVYLRGQIGDLREVMGGRTYQAA